MQTLKFLTVRFRPNKLIQGWRGRALKLTFGFFLLKGLAWLGLTFYLGMTISQ